MIQTTDQSYFIQPIVQQREAFARRLLHDMRNPLAGIVLNTQLLQARGEYNAQQQRFVNQILAEAERLRYLLDHMGLLNKLQQGQQCLRRQRTDPRTLLREAISKWETAPSRQNKEMLVTIPAAPIPQLLVNRTFLQRLLDILLGHAIRFTPEHAHITVDLTVTVDTLHKESLYQEQRHPLAKITITDQGPPLPEQVLPDLSEFVEEWDVIVSDRAGIGLSLALCQMIAEALDGTLTITNNLPCGVSYLVALPIPDSEWLPYVSPQ